MSPVRKNLIAKTVLFYLLDRDQVLAKKIAGEAGVIANENQDLVEEKEIRDLLDPWVKNIGGKKKKDRG